MRKGEVNVVGEPISVFARKIPVERLANKYNAEHFPFTTTAEVKGLSAEMIGQDRAVNAIEFGLNVKQEGYHLCLVGPNGTGKTTYARSKAIKKASKELTPFDWLYVFNFRNPDRPVAISLPAGKGRLFQREVKELVENIKKEIKKKLASQAFIETRDAIIEKHEYKIHHQWQQLHEQALDGRFELEKNNDGVMVIPLDEKGEPYTDEDFRLLPKEQQQQIVEQTMHLNKKYAEISLQNKKVEKELRFQLKEQEEKTISEAIHQYTNPILKRYENSEKIVTYITELQRDMVLNREQFLEAEGDAHTEDDLLTLLLQNKEVEKKELHRYEVNVFVDNSECTGAPVVYESNPTHANLFGKFEYQSAFGGLVTNFTLLKPGSLHLANGGYIILQAADLINNPYTWQAVKRMLKDQQIRIEAPVQETALAATSGLKPEPIPIKTKILLIMTPTLYQLLHRYDADFQKYFKVKAEFDTVMERTQENCLKFAAFVSSFCEREKLQHFSKEAMARIIDYSTRTINDQRMLSTCFHEVTEVLVEANYWAIQESSEFVNELHVRKALKERMYRANLVEEKIKQLIDDGTIMIETDGEVVGQINGLSVLNTGDYTFGQPNRITARTFIGSEGIVNIDRESYLSGPIHSKGLFILSGYIQGEFARNRPIPLSASITFEQSYDMVDGDSASSTELYAILSSLCEVPIKQGIAVTGSVNQFGEIQPIGGVNEKIEGFFFTCKAKGLTGEQGVIIPVQNEKNLMLCEEVIEAVRLGEFHLWSVHTIQEGMEILTGVSAGEKNNEGNYKEGTLFYQVKERITEMADLYKKEYAYKGRPEDV